MRNLGAGGPGCDEAPRLSEGTPTVALSGIAPEAIWKMAQQDSQVRKKALCMCRSKAMRPPMTDIDRREYEKAAAKELSGMVSSYRKLRHCQDTFMASLLRLGVNWRKARVWLLVWLTGHPSVTPYISHCLG